MSTMPPTPPGDENEPRTYIACAAVPSADEPPAATPAPADTVPQAAVVLRADGARWEAEARRAGARAGALGVEVRTLRERLVVARARAAALEQRSAEQAAELEKYRQALAGAAEGLRRQQNLAASYPLHVAAVLAERGRWLLAEYRRRGLRGRLKLLPRLAELLDVAARLGAAAAPAAEWEAARAELEAVRAAGWRRLLTDRAALRRSLANLARRFRRSA